MAVSHISFLTKDTDKPTDLIAAIGAIDWGAGQFLVKRLLSGDLDQNDVVIVLTTSNGDLMGFVALLKHDIADLSYEGPYLSTLYVVPSYRSQGLSRQLITLVEEAAQVRDYHEIYTITRHQGLYEKYGFTFLEDIKDQFGRDMRVLRKSLVD
ncbi:GNAT family N-acetyltransferase [Streptococcus pluranimalium]